MAIIKTSWLKNKHGEKFAPITLAQKVFMKNGTNLQQFLENDLLFSVKGHNVFVEGESYPSGDFGYDYYIYESTYPKTLDITSVDQLDLLFKLSTPMRGTSNKEEILELSNFIMLDEAQNIWIF